MPKSSYPGILDVSIMGFLNDPMKAAVISAAVARSIKKSGMIMEQK